MQIQVQLHGILRDKLPPAEKGKLSLQVQPGETIQSIFNRLDIRTPVIVALNDLYEADPHLELGDGDQVNIFPVSGGG